MWLCGAAVWASIARPRADASIRPYKLSVNFSVGADARIGPPRPQRSKAAREHIECSPTAAKAACLTVRRGGFYIRPWATNGRPYKQRCRFSAGPQCCHITHHRGRAEMALPLQVVCRLFKFCRLFCSGDADQALSFFFLVPISTPTPPTTSSAPMPLNSSVPKPPVVGRLKPFLLMMVVSTY